MDAFDNPLAAPAEVEQWAKPNLYSKSVEELQELSRAIGVPEIDIEEASAKPDATEALADLIAPRTVSHHFREWAIICSHEEALGADKATGKPEVMVTELEERLRSLGLQVEGHPTPLQTEYILQISAPEHTLRFWATRMGLLMRLKGDPTKNRRHAEFGGSKSLVPRARACVSDCVPSLTLAGWLLPNSGAVQGHESAGVSSEQTSASRVLDL